MALGHKSAAVWPTVALLSLPAAAVFGLLWATELLSGLYAMGGFLLAAAGTFALVSWLVGDIYRVAVFIDDNEARPEEIPRPTFGPAATLATTVARARQRRQHERAKLTQETETVRSIFEQLPAPLLLLDRQRTVVMANRAAESLLRRWPATGPLLDLIREPGVLEAVDICLEDGVENSVEFELLQPRRRILSATIKPFGDGLADDLAAMVLIDDLTNARRIDQMRVDFVANASHELRTPLSTLTGYIETLRGPASEDPSVRDRFLGIMHDQASRMTRLVDDLMSLSRIEMEADIEPDGVVDLVPLVQDQVEALQITAGDRQMQFAIDRPANDRALLVDGDRDQIVQVLQNLLDNAIKYGRANSTIRIRLGRRRGPDGSQEVFMSVHDRGEGIAPEHVQRLTERFYRVDQGRSREMGGTGLGLAIVKHIVHRHRGRLEIESALGEGSEFTVFLPAHQARQDIAAQ